LSQENVKIAMMNLVTIFLKWATKSGWTLNESIHSNCSLCGTSFHIWIL